MAATAEGVCVGRLASGTTKGVLCFDPSLRHYGLVEGGPAPLVASSHATVFAGGSALKDISPQSRSASTFRLPRGATVTALAAHGSSLWAAVESTDKRPRAVIYHIIGQTTVSRTPTGARYIQNIAVNDAGIWVLSPAHKHMVLSAVEPNGTLKLAATLPDDARSLTATAGALWTANFRDSTVARITGYTSKQ